ncbi:MAG: radical SAM protein, partial [Candidatus Syntropharchaeia archaeon]
GIGIPYNPSFISIDEVYRIGERIATLEPKIQVTVLDYRPEFRRMDIKKPVYEEMLYVKRVLEETGLRCVICQTERGHVGP